MQLAVDRKFPLNKKSCAHPKLLLRDAGLGAPSCDESIEFDTSCNRTVIPEEKNDEEAEEREGETGGSPFSQGCKRTSQIATQFMRVCQRLILYLTCSVVPAAQSNLPAKVLRSITLDTDFN